MKNLLFTADDTSNKVINALMQSTCDKNKYSTKMMKAHILVAEQGGRGKFKIFSFSKISQSVCFGAGLGRNKQELPIFGYFVQFLGPVHS